MVGKKKKNNALIQTTAKIPNLGVLGAIHLRNTRKHCIAVRNTFIGT
jgi:hypothetical protein